MNNVDRTFRPDVEGLRAVAVALVVLGHAGVSRVEGGYVGVDVFFVLSGFLITGLLIRERASTGSTSMPGFYARRARRILPAASVVLVATVLASYHWLGFLRGGVVAEDGKWTAVFAANLHFASSGTQYLRSLAPPSPLQHYWSLAVEEQFYLVWPLVFLTVATVAPRVSLAGKLAGVLTLIVVASFTWSVVQTGTNITWAFFSPLTRAWELAIGALLAVCVPRLGRLPTGIAPWLSWVGLGGVAGSAFLFDASSAFPGYAASLPVAGTAMVVAAGTIAPRRGAEKVLALAPFQWLGKWSYSLYLWHWPVLIIAEQQARRSLSMAESLSLVALALVLAAVSHHVVENPVRYARPLTAHPWSSLSLGFCLVVAAYGVCYWEIRDHSNPGLPVRAVSVAGDSSPASPLEDVLKLVAAAPEIKTLPDDLTPDLYHATVNFGWMTPGTLSCLADFPEVTSPGCVLGDPGGSRTVVLLGDSHAAMWLDGFDSVGKDLHWRVLVLAKTGCPAAAISFSRDLAGTPRLIAAYPECGPWLDSAISRINETSPEVVILASCNGCEYMVDARGDVVARSAWADGLQRTLDRITPDGTRKVVLGDIPRWSGALDCLAMNADNVQACSKQVRPALDVTYNDVEQDVATRVGVPYIDVTAWFCSSVCTAVVGNMVVYSNDYHVTATYATYLSGALQEALQPILDGK